MGNYDDYTAYFNGEWVPYSEVLFPPHDRGFAVADVVFDQGRTFGGVPFRLEDHVNRLYRSLKYVRVDPGFGEEEMLEVCREGVARNDHRRAEVGDFAINPIITRGASVDGPPSVCVIIKPIHFEEFARFYMDGAHAIITKVRSYSSSMLDAKVKHHSRMNFVLAELEARDVDPEGLPLLLDVEGNVTEGLGYNVFIVNDGVLKTPKDDNILQGVSRQVVFELAEGLGIPALRGRPSTIRPVHRRRGVLQPYQPEDHARVPGRQEADWGRDTGAGDSATAGGAQRACGRGYCRAEFALRGD